MFTPKICIPSFTYIIWYNLGSSNLPNQIIYFEWIILIYIHKLSINAWIYERLFQMTWVASLECNRLKRKCFVFKKRKIFLHMLIYLYLLTSNRPKIWQTSCKITNETFSRVNINIFFKIHEWECARITTFLALILYLFADKIHFTFSGTIHSI